MSELKDQRVLLIAPRFFGYEKDIAREIERRGAVVHWLPDRPFDTPLMKAVTKTRADWVMPAADRLYARMLDAFDEPRYDIVLVVNGQTLSRKSLARLRSICPTARFILYVWDSIANRRGVVETLNQFDRALSFDPIDARTYGMQLRPLFYGPDIGMAAQYLQKNLYDISFVGTAHADRYGVVAALRGTLPEGLRTYWYLYLQAPWVLLAYQFANPSMRGARRSDFHFEPLPKQELQDVFARSHSIFDVEHPMQHGLTMRTFETLGSGKKLVTTNVHARDYDFFTPSNICIVDRHRPVVPRSFFETPFEPLHPVLRYRYSIRGWLDDVLDLPQPAGAALARATG